MNIELMTEVRDFLASMRSEFDMKSWFDVLPQKEYRIVNPAKIVSCGTPACIGGTAMALANPDCDYDLWTTMVYNEHGNELCYMSDFLLDLFGLSQSEGDHLFNVMFWPDWATSMMLQSDERAAAVALLTRLIDTGSTECLFNDGEES